MRIIIEDTQAVLQGHSSTVVDAAPLEDGGAAPGDLLQLLGGVSSQVPAGQFPALQDAGPPPAWLVIAVSEASVGSPAYTVAGTSSGGSDEPIPDAVDGGSAPELPVK